MVVFLLQHAGLAITTGIVLLTLVVVEWLYFRLKSTPIAPVIAAIFIERHHASIWDFRSESDFLKIHITGARHMTYEQIVPSQNTLDLTKPLILITSTPVPNWKILSTLKWLGFTKLYHLEGGMEYWENSHLPIASQH